MWGRGGPGCTRTLGPGKGRCELRRGSRRRQFMEERLFTGGHFPGVRGEGGSRGASVPGVGLGRGRVGGTGAHGASEQAGGAPQKSDLASFGDGAACDYWFNPPPPPPPPCVAGVIRPHSVPGHTASWSPGRPLAHATPPGAPPVCLVAGRGRGEAEWGPSLERGEPDSSEGAPALGPAPRPHPLQGGWGRVGPVSGRALQSCLCWEGPVACHSALFLPHCRPGGGGSQVLPLRLGQAEGGAQPPGEVSEPPREGAGRAGPTGAGHVWPSVGSGLGTFWVFTLWLKRPT